MSIGSTFGAGGSAAGAEAWMGVCSGGWAGVGMLGWVGVGF